MDCIYFWLWRLPIAISTNAVCQIEISFQTRKQRKNDSETKTLKDFWLHISPKLDPQASIFRGTAVTLAIWRSFRAARRAEPLLAPKAAQPAAPEGCSGQVEVPDFWQYANTLEEALDLFVVIWLGTWKLCLDDHIG